jgi:sterol desaturase/sphingolipid hydroxylase (fatty acid hydroxylase superfamily)
MRASYIALAVPFFFVLIAVELAVARARGRRLYRLGDTLGDLGCGMIQQVSYIFLTASILAGYTYVYDHLRLTTWGPGPAVWVVTLVAVDFLYYWWHRASHEVSVFWAAHVVHHQSEEYNLAVALRQATLTGYTAQVFYVTLAFAGVPPLVFASVNAINTLYQFWIHTELVGKLGWLEEWLNTPSHHRVHHAVNPRYLDKNYGATLIVWDRLFGTFAREEEAPVYGIVKPFASFNPLWAQVEPVIGLFRASLAAPRALDKLRVFWKPPGWRPEGVPPYPGLADGSYLTRPKYEARPPRRRRVYVVVQFGLGLAATAALMLGHDAAPRPVLAAGAAFVGLTLATCAGLFESRRWAVPLEAARVGLVALVAAGAIAWKAGVTGG